MGEYARAHDVRGVYVLTPPPSICKVPLCAVPAAPNYQIVLDRNEHTRVLGHLLTTAAFPPGVVAVDLRDRWHTVVNGWWEHVDAFGLHPTPSGRVPMANWIAEAIETDRAIQR
jgi:hypothetical protein